MNYRNYAIIEYLGETEINESFNEVLDKGNYLIIDKEEFARQILETYKDTVSDDKDWDIIIDNELAEYRSDILGLLQEALYNE